MKISTSLVFIALFFVSVVSNAQEEKTFKIISDTTRLNGFGSSGNQLILINGTENRKNAFLKNKVGGLTEFNFAVDSVWINADTLFVQRALLHKFKLGSASNSLVKTTNGLTILNDSIRLGGDLNVNTDINLNNHYYTLKQDLHNFSLFSPSTFLSQRVNANFKTLFEQQQNFFSLNTSNNNDIGSLLLLNDTLSTLQYKHTSLILNNQRISYGAKQHYFNGDWLKIPEKSQRQIDSSQLFRPAGSLIYNNNTKGLYVSDGSRMSSTAIEYLDGDEIQTSTPTSWATNNGIKIPLFRVRHPNNISGLDNGKSINQDFKIIPYQYGMAIEYNGVLENWVGEFSIHRGLNYIDLGDGGDGWGAALWVGDDYDSGGLRMTARNNTITGGSLKWTEISSEQFSAASAGNLRLRLVDSTDRVDFVTGSRGSKNVYAFINTTGLKFPLINNINTISSPIKGLTVFDDSDSTLKVYTGINWKGLGADKRLGSDTINANTTLSYNTKQVQYVNTTNGNVSIVLPAITNNVSGLIFKIIKTDNTSNIITVTASGINTINGVTSKSIQSQFECMNLYSNGSNEWIATKETGY